MKFTNSFLVAVLGLGSQVSCAPRPIPEPKPAVISPQSLVNNINGIYQIGVEAINKDLAAITQAVNTYANSVGSQLTLVVQLKADLDAISKQTDSTVSQILQSTKTAGTELTGDEVQALITTLYAVGNFTLAAEQVIDTNVKGLQTSTKALILQELAAAKTALPKLLAPFQAYANGTALQGGFSGMTLLSALTTALTTVLGSVSTLLKTLGIESLT